MCVLTPQNTNSSTINSIYLHLLPQVLCRLLIPLNSRIWFSILRGYTNGLNGFKILMFLKGCVAGRPGRRCILETQEAGLTTWSHSFCRTSVPGRPIASAGPGLHRNTPKCTHRQLGQSVIVCFYACDPLCLQCNQSPDTLSWLPKRTWQHLSPFVRGFSRSRRQWHCYSWHTRAVISYEGSFYNEVLQIRKTAMTKIIL